MHTYFVAFTTYEPTGGIFPAWRDVPRDAIVTLQHPVTDDIGLGVLRRELMSRLEKVHRPTDPDGHDYIVREHWLGTIHFEAENFLMENLAITTVQHLHSRPSGAHAP